jgi:general stress protein 26
MSQERERNTEERERFVALAKEFDTAMLCTRSSFGMLRSRPMAVADVDDHGRMWFLTTAESGKVEELRDHSDVNVVMQGKTAYVSLTGRGYAVKDPQKVVDLWQESWRPWFPDGPEQADLVFIRVDPTIGEFWDDRGAKGAKYLWEAAKAYVQGDQVDEEALEGEIHAKVEL